MPDEQIAGCGERKDLSLCFVERMLFLGTNTLPQSVIHLARVTWPMSRARYSSHLAIGSGAPRCDWRCSSNKSRLAAIARLSGWRVAEGVLVFDYNLVTCGACDVAYLVECKGLPSPVTY